MQWKLSLRLLVLVVCACFVYWHHTAWRKIDTKSLVTDLKTKTRQSAPQSYQQMCNQTQSDQVIPAYYWKSVLKLDLYTKEHGGIQTGHIGSRTNQLFVYLNFLNASFVNTVCETGFNAGHSSLLWLIGNPKTTVYSFDMGSFSYSKPNARFLQAEFPGRLKVFWGDSKVSIPRFTKEHPEVVCDIIFIDGGHHFKEVHADLTNLRAHANRKEHILSVDDYTSDLKSPERGVTQAWDKEVKEGRVHHSYSCRGRIKLKAWAFAVGQYINL